MFSSTVISELMVEQGRHHGKKEIKYVSVNAMPPIFFLTFVSEWSEYENWQMEISWLFCFYETSP